MCRVYRQSDTKKPTALRGRGLAVNAKTGWRPVAVPALLQLHSIFLRGRLLLGQAMDITPTQ
jgi:hypothetical protein